MRELTTSSLMIMQGRISHPVRSLVADFPSMPSTDQRRCLHHLQLEKQLVDICAPTLHALNCTEVEMIDEVPDVEKMLESWPALLGQLEQCRVKAAQSNASRPFATTLAELQILRLT